MDQHEKHLLDNYSRSAMNTLEMLYNLTGDEAYWKLRGNIHELMCVKLGEKA